VDIPKLSLTQSEGHGFLNGLFPIRGENLPNPKDIFHTAMMRVFEINRHKIKPPPFSNGKGIQYLPGLYQLHGIRGFNHQQTARKHQVK